MKKTQPRPQAFSALPIFVIDAMKTLGLANSKYLICWGISKPEARDSTTRMFL